MSTTKKSAEKVANDATETTVEIKTPAAKQVKPKLLSIRLEKLHPFENHPYKVLDDDSMTELKNSIAEQGFLNRIIVRPLEDNPEEYEIISGHRRVHAAGLLGIKEIPASVYSVDRDTATVMMVESNCQRENLTLMEKAKSYRMKLEAIKHQGTSRQSVGKSEESADKISETESGRTVQRLIRLTYLVPELQEYVDAGKMKLLPAVEISYLDEENQRDIVDLIDDTEIFPSHAQARRMKTLFEEGKLDYDAVTEIMNELKPNQVEKLKIPMDDIRGYVPKDYTPQQISELAVKLFKQNYERQQRNRDDAR